MGILSKITALFSSSSKSRAVKTKPVVAKPKKAATPKKTPAKKSATPKKKTPAKKSTPKKSAKKTPAKKKAKKAKKETTYLELVQGTQSKYWMISVKGKTTTVGFGRIAHGAKGTEQPPKVHETAAAARQFYGRQISNKEKKGFTSLGLVPE